jgi:hypothetical protein
MVCICCVPFSENGRASTFTKSQRVLVRAIAFQGLTNVTCTSAQKDNFFYLTCRLSSGKQQVSSDEAGWYEASSARTGSIWVCILCEKALSQLAFCTNQKIFAKLLLVHKNRGFVNMHRNTIFQETPNCPFYAKWTFQLPHFFIEEWGHLRQLRTLSTITFLHLGWEHSKIYLIEMICIVTNDGSYNYRVNTCKVPWPVFQIQLPLFILFVQKGSGVQTGSLKAASEVKQWHHNCCATE